MYSFVIGGAKNKNILKLKEVSALRMQTNKYGCSFLSTLREESSLQQWKR